MIIKNAIRCNLCGDEIESKHRHDFVTCKCGSCSVDGGHDYLRRCFKEEECYTDISICKPDSRKEEYANEMSHSFVASCGSNLFSSLCW